MNTVLRDSLVEFAKYQENTERFANGEVEKCAQLNRTVNDRNSSMQNSNEISQTYSNTEKLYSQFANEMEHLSLSLKKLIYDSNCPQKLYWAGCCIIKRQTLNSYIIALSENRPS